MDPQMNTDETGAGQKAVVYEVEHRIHIDFNKRPSPYLFSSAFIGGPTV